ncbi:hypothetical protein PR048_019793 [Dryococelus australis]|uniref:Uncharacterized protein n=1 Tax=Dryococelus australis TaxID=614101 RepID=A0ABQ9H4I1_9NEOP|nr:hypothetical protein PR048_019793 [Dryococelus australis]
MPVERSENMVRKPVDQPKLEAFNKCCNFLDDNDDCQYLMSDLMEMLLKFSAESDKLCGGKHLRELLSARYSNNVVISSRIKCFGTVASFRPIASRILTENSYAIRKKSLWKKEEDSRCG